MRVGIPLYALILVSLEVWLLILKALTAMQAHEGEDFLEEVIGGIWPDPQHYSLLVAPPRQAVGQS